MLRFQHLFALCLIASAKAFSLNAATRHTKKFPIAMCDGPSDIESSGTETVVSSIASSASGLGSPIKDFLLDGTSALSRAEINEYVLSLEKENPTKEPASSKLLNGVWEVKSTGFGSPGLVGLQVIKAISSEIVDDVIVTISSVAPRVVASSTLKLATAKIDISVTTDVEATSPVRLTEKVSAVKLGTLDVPLGSLSLPNFLLSRDIFITYLDEDLLIARDALGTPEILTRKIKTLFGSDAGVPDSTGSDTGAPGV